jgi:hypothetical protein
MVWRKSCGREMVGYGGDTQPLIYLTPQLHNTTTSTSEMVKRASTQTREFLI